MRPRVTSRALTSTVTVSPTTSRTKFRLRPDGACATSSPPPATATRYNARGRIAATVPVTALRSPAILLLCLERLLRRFHPTRRVTGPDDVDAVAEVMAGAHREGLLFSFRPFQVSW